MADVAFCTKTVSSSGTLRMRARAALEASRRSGYV